MPYKRKYPTRRRFKKRYRRKSYPRRRIDKTLFGDKKLVRMKYHEGISLAPGLTGQPDSFVFSAGSLFDPNVSGTGHQPRGFDQIIALYSHYTVISSKCTATFIQNSEVAGQNDTEAMAVGIVMRHDTSILTDQSAILEDRNVRWKTIAPAQSGGNVRVVQKFNPKSFLGISKPMSSANLRGSVVSSPSESGFFQIFAMPISYEQPSGELQVSVDIVYTAVFTEPQQPGQS